MRFLVDAQLPPGLCAGLAKRGHGAVHVADVLPGQTPDRAVYAYALRERCVLITKDDDFSGREYRSDVPIVWLRIGNATNAGLKQWLDERWGQIEAALDAGECLIEVR